jgi:hypothetical protein
MLQLGHGHLYFMLHSRERDIVFVVSMLFWNADAAVELVQH